MSDNTVILEVKELHKSFDGHEVLKGISTTIKKGDVLALIGPSGCGKSTFLRSLNLLEIPTAGHVLFEGTDLTDPSVDINHVREKIGMVFQQFNLFPNMTILENMALADNKGKPFNLRPGTNRQRVEFYREQLHMLGLGLEDKMDVKVGVLSGGQRQAMALLMSTMTPIEFLILDEHTAALDPKTADIIMELTDKVVKEKHLTTIMVTHNLRYAVEYGNRLLMMHQGHAIIDKAGEEKKQIQIDHILEKFNEISIECGN